MKQTILAAMVLIAFASCGDSGNGTSTPADSVTTGTGTMTDTSITNSSTGSMMDTTGHTGHSDSVASGSPNQLPGSAMDTMKRADKSIRDTIRRKN